jgi:endonuclease/exonuclease/phosphatase family metal-dependent hydrolase
MKLVSFNTWGGTIYESLMDYIGKLSEDTDIFCFQEIFSALPGAPVVSSGARMFLFEELSALLKDFTGFFDLSSEGCDFNGPLAAPVSYGLAVFIRHGLEVKSRNIKLIATTNQQIDRLVKAQIFTLVCAGMFLDVINFHGIAKPGDKLDTEERINQSKKLAEAWRSLGSMSKILCGDFNLMPQTQSVKILQDCGRNLIREFNIQNTRNKISWTRFNNKQNFADYCFVSSGVKVKNFQVPYTEASDHLAMVLEFDL